MKFALLNNINQNTENPSEEEIFLVTVQLIVAVAFIVSWLTNAILTYDLYLKKTGQKPLFKDDTASKIGTYNQCYTLALIIVIVFINYNYIKVSKEKENGNVNSAIGQFIVSLLTLSASTLSLFILLRNLERQFNRNDLENSEV